MKRPLTIAPRPAWTAATIGLLFLAPGCAAPPSEELGGEAGAAVERSLESGQGVFDHALWEGVLSVTSIDGWIDYEKAAQERGLLEEYLHLLAEIDIGDLAPDELKALLINAYNALTVESILRHPDISSIKEIPGVWDETRHRLGGFELTLDEIEHGLLRPYFKDPRIHFAVNCASASCATLPSWAFDGTGIETQLDERAATFLRDPANVALEGGTLRLSRYFDWYGDDFTADGWSPRADSVPDFVALYGDDELRTRLAATPGVSIAYFDYDWSLNNAAVRGR